ncbi:hypothetical protein A1O1_04174 [Capronia coronata CBS 617.96]|uniref:Methyltransferase domain-containing protein n=1 Tax=Capronia coronata CBS 617.96 TaxID=1182541 RepID=W9YDW2_9EURO|nr:uncharacterized protein A1O1_04174 [Capronia coronata CBS 617.96]EXJ91067.1 hypothetical protein A1O1_04174 [Capronia coronata CBS 617.96]
MPRLPPALIREAALQNHLLPLLLRACRDLPSARNEFRWLQEHARDTVHAKTRKRHKALPEDALIHLKSPRHGEEKSQCPQRKDSSVKSKADRLEKTSVAVDANSRRSLFRRRVFVHRGHRNSVVSHTSGRGLRDAFQEQYTARSHAQSLLAKFIARRARGVPLQYILGNQPFGNLEILTRKGVLIPRSDTETYSQHVAKLLLSWLHTATFASHTRLPGRRKLRILDLCSGTGCIALLLHSVLKPPNLDSNIDLEILGADISMDANLLSRRNLQHNIAEGLLHPDAAQDVSFQQMDILRLARSNRSKTRRLFNHGSPSAHQDAALDDTWDVIVSNPPYISPKDYRPGGQTNSSVRKYEPKLALVPPVSGSSGDANPAVDPGDLFYGPLIDLMSSVGAKLLVMEVGDSQQAGRVHEIAMEKFKNRDDDVRFERWKDDGTERLLSTSRASHQGLTDGLAAEGTQAASATTDSHASDRAVVVWARELAEWRMSVRWDGRV